MGFIAHRALKGFAFTLLAALAAPARGTAVYTYTDLFTLNTLPGFTGIHFQGGDRYVAVGGAVLGYSSAPDGYVHAMLWNKSSKPVDLTPAGDYFSIGYGMGGGQQFGGAAAISGGQTHAMLWSGGSVAVDLHPPGYSFSIGFGTDGVQQVGQGLLTGTASSAYRALLWNGTNSVIDLHPAGYAESTAYSAGGGQQVGQGSFSGAGFTEHALLWRGTNAVVDLNPAGWTYSYAIATDGVHQVGFGSPTGGLTHALLWAGTNVPVDFNPAGAYNSEAYAVSGGQQAGYASGPVTGNKPHAMLWNGTSAGTDLGALAPPGYTSEAYAVDQAGNAFGLATDPGGTIYSVAWLVPEPTGLSLVALSALLLLRRNRNGRQSA